MTYARLSMNFPTGTHANAERLVQKLAQDTEAYAKTHMNSQSPAPAGEFPGIDTGNLVNNILSERVGPLTWRCFIPGERVPYAVALEYGTGRMMARPFMAPSFMAIVNGAPPGLFAEVVT